MVEHLARRRAHDRRRRPFLGARTEPFDEGLQRRGNAPQHVGADEVARVQRDDEQLLGGGASGQLLGEQHVRQLRHRILRHAREALGRSAQRVEVDAAPGVVVTTARHDDHPCGSAVRGRRPSGQQRKELGDEEEVPEVVHAEGQLETLSGATALARHPGVRHQQVDRFSTFRQHAGCPPHLGQVGEVQFEELELVTAGRGADLIHRVAGLGLITAREDHPIAPRRQR